MQGTDSYSAARVAVTHPLTPNACDACRGLQSKPFPRAERRGATTKIHRYYWRELWTEAHLRFLQWCDAEGIPTRDESGKSVVLRLEHQHKDRMKQVEREVLAEVKQLHAVKPKYVYDEPSDAEVLKDNGVRITDVKAAYLTPTRDRVLVLPLGVTDQSQAQSVEEFVATRLRADGREVMFCESLPFQAIYGCLMWLWVQDPADPLVRPAGVRRKGEGGTDGQLVWTLLPADYGRQAHADRRQAKLEEHLDFIGTTTEDLLRAFDYWLEYSRPLRQYLWAYSPEDEQRARVIIGVLGVERVKTILRWLAEAYWDRYVGWPDLLTWRDTPEGPSDILFVEVKSSSDQLSDDQKTWIEGNREKLGFDFEIVKVHRTERVHVAGANI